MYKTEKAPCCKIVMWIVFLCVGWSYPGSAIADDRQCNEQIVLRTDQTCGVESYRQCLISQYTRELSCGHYSGYLGELDRYGGGYGDKVVSWFRYNDRANPYVGNQNVSYRVLNFGTGMNGSAMIFEADIACYENVKIYGRQASCGIESYRSCYVRVKDPNCKAIKE